MIATIPLSIQNKLLTLPELTIWFNGQGITIYDAFLDTGSGGTLLDADLVAQIGISYATGMDIRTIYGIGDPENVFEQVVDLNIGGVHLAGFVVEVGNMQQYGFEALIGLDFLLATRAMIDLGSMSVTLRT